jgi:glutathionylspermidine synthase
MERIAIAPRPDWRERVEALGLDWHTADDGRAYWDESAYWRLSMAEVDRIEEATAELYQMVLTAVAEVISRGELSDMGYGPAASALIAHSWENFGWEPTLYARFDLAYDGKDLKLLELNGDTPTSLLEAAVVQWAWMEERFPHLDQFNSIHDRLIGGLNLYREHIGPAALHLTSAAPHAEDEGTVAYVSACAEEAGIPTRLIAQQDIGLRQGPRGGHFVDLDDRPITDLFKLIPWEWLLDDPFGEDLAAAVRAGEIRLIEPAWKMAASNKRLLVTLKELYPDSPLLLDATVDARRARAWPAHVRKPVLGREGANVEIVEDGHTAATLSGAYADDLMVFQEKANLAQADGRYAVVGSWIVDREPAGIGIRESAGPITGNAASFVPHVIEG